MQHFDEPFFKKAAVVFFICFFITGCFIFSDYGISWDENVQRTQIGSLNYQYIKTGDNTALAANFHKYYGPSFEIILFAAEDIFNVTDLHHVFLLRHAITFLAFFCAVICFYLMCVKLFKSHKIALLASVILVLSPRIFADSFYNCKDLAMLCFCVIATYTMFVFIEKQTILNAFLHGLACGFMLDIRIMGIVIPVATVYLFITQKEKKLIPFFVYLFYTLLFIVIFWPILWHDPIHNFIGAFKQMSNFQVMGSTNLFMGDLVPAANLPWYYAPVWIGITTPIVYSILFLIGLYFAFKNIVIDFKNTFPIQSILFLCFSPVMAVILLNSTLYDGWRHLFFVYPYFVIIAVYGFVQLIKVIKDVKIVRLVSFTTVAALVLVLIIMVKNHPFQNVYFNVLGGNDIHHRYEFEYWGLSYKQGLEYILEHDKSEQIQVAAANSPGFLNFNSIPTEEAKRLVWTNHPQEYDFGTPVFEINIDNEKIMEVRKLR
jgi:hypothetical protein